MVRWDKVVKETVNKHGVQSTITKAHIFVKNLSESEKRVCPYCIIDYRGTMSAEKMEESERAGKALLMEGYVNIGRNYSGIYFILERWGIWDEERGVPMNPFHAGAVGLVDCKTLVPPVFDPEGGE